MKSPFSMRSLLAVVAVATLDCRLGSVGAQEAPSSASSPPAASTRVDSAMATHCTVCSDATGWWLVTPSGERFFSLGVCMFNQGLPSHEYNPARPGYAAFRHYDLPEAWARASLARIKSWGFTTVGGWSDYHIVSQVEQHNLWLTPVLHLGSTSGAPWFDMWDENVLRRIEEVADQNMHPLHNDRRILGYYSDNELGWWNAILWKMALEQPATSGQRRQLIRLVRDVYHNDWHALARDFEPENAAGWDELERAGMLWLRPGSQGIHTMRRFLSLVADRYYDVMRTVIRRRAPDVLYLGDRYQSFYYPEVPLAGRRHVDVVSTNLNASWNDGTFVPSYLDTLHELTGKPVLVSEFYMAAEQNRSGNPNASGGFPTVGTQPERAAALANTLRALVQLPYVVGADWFQYYDEPPHGRKLDGEDYNFGLVDIHDVPYEEVTAAFSSLNVAELKATPPAPRHDAAQGVPRAPRDPFAHFEPMTALRHWDRQRGRVIPTSRHPVGDLYVCWSPTALYLATYVLDILEPDYYRDNVIPEIDRPLWTVRIGDRELLSVRLGAGRPPAVHGPQVRVASLSGTYHKVRCITALELPATLLGKDHLAPGDRIELNSTFTTHGRAQQIDWNGELTLAD